MGNSSLLQAYIERNPKFSDEEVSLRLGVPVKQVHEARGLGSRDLVLSGTTKERMFSTGKDSPDVVQDTVASLKTKLRQLDQSFGVARKEFLLDPNIDNASNMSTFLTDIKSTLKDLDQFTDKSAIAEQILKEVFIPFAKEIMTEAYTQTRELLSDLKEYLPKSIQYRVKEFPSDFSTAVGRKSNECYDNAIDVLGNLMDVDLSQFRTSDKLEEKGKRKKNK